MYRVSGKWFSGGSDVRHSPDWSCVLKGLGSYPTLVVGCSSYERVGSPKLLGNQGVLGLAEEILLETFVSVVLSFNRRHCCDIRMPFPGQTMLLR